MQKIGIIGAGFTGLSAAYFLTKAGYPVTIFEKESSVAGTAAGFKKKSWQFFLEEYYHHFFANDAAGRALMKEVGSDVLIRQPITSIYRNNKIAPLDSFFTLVKFPLLNPVGKLRVGLTILFCKIIPGFCRYSFIPQASWLEQKTAVDFFGKLMGKKSFEIIFKPLLAGKFGNYAPRIGAIWLWARIKKRTKKLIYPIGGFQSFANQLAEKIKKFGGTIINLPVENITKNRKWAVHSGKKIFFFDKLILALPLPAAREIFPLLPNFEIDHLDALSLILETNRSLIKKTYWLNINEENFPFLAIVEHTNFVSRRFYGGCHLVYLGNYLAQGHDFFNLSKEKLVDSFLPYLKKINPRFEKSNILEVHKFKSAYAQPVVETDHRSRLPPMKLEEIDAKQFKGLYLASADMIYPWDRGMNYAIELGKKVANEISNF